VSRWRGRVRAMRVVGVGWLWGVAVRGGVPIKGVAVASAVRRRVGCRGMYSRWLVRMMGSLATARLGSISSATATLCEGSCRSSSSQPGRVRVSRCGGLREASDLSVAQAVVDEREDLARSRDACLVGAATFGELVRVGSEVRAAVRAADALDQRRAHQP